MSLNENDNNDVKMIIPTNITNPGIITISFQIFTIIFFQNLAALYDCIKIIIHGLRALC